MQKLTKAQFKNIIAGVRSGVNEGDKKGSFANRNGRREEYCSDMMLPRSNKNDYFMTARNAATYQNLIYLR